MTEPGLQFIWHILFKTHPKCSRFDSHLNSFILRSTESKLYLLTLILKTHIVPNIPKLKGIKEFMDYVFINVRKQIRQKRKGVSAC